MSYVTFFSLFFSSEIFLKLISGGSFLTEPTSSCFGIKQLLLWRKKRGMDGKDYEHLFRIKLYSGENYGPFTLCQSPRGG